MTEKKRPSVAEILAAARKEKAGGDAAGAPAEPAAPQPPAAETIAEPAAETPAVEPAAEAAPAAPAPKPRPAGGKMSVAEMLAAARAGDKAKAPSAAPAASKESPKPAPAPKPAAPAKEKPAAKPAAEKPNAEGAPVRDTASVLAALRGGAKPGPMSKAEAAAKAKPDADAEKPAKAKAEVPPMPARPVLNPKSAKATKETDEPRRWFLAVMLFSPLALGFSAIAATTGLWSLGIARFMFPNILTEPPSRFKVGFPAEFPPGGVEEKFKAQFGVWIVNTEYHGARQIFALRTVCTHLGCTPNWLEAEQKFKCPCHGSGFYKDGINFEGPAPRPLERYSIAIADDGQLEVDKSKLFFEEQGQWSDPSSFVAS